MKTGIFCASESNHWKLGCLAANVARQYGRVYHLTGDIAKLDGADKVLRTANAPMAVMRMRLHQTPGDWLFIDTDVLIHKDVSHVFGKPFDIAVAQREQGFKGIRDADGTKMEDMPHNMGVVFSRCPQFWIEVEEGLLKLEPRLQQWMGDQIIFNRLIKSTRYKVEILPIEYNYAPDKKTGDPKNAFIVHYKGSRKPFMVTHACDILYGIDGEGTEASQSLST